MDIVLVTYNSTKWIDRCLNAIGNSKGVTESLNVYVVDNNSADNTLEKLKQYKENNHIVGLDINSQKDNLGFGNANNVGAKMGTDDIVCFINIDTEVYSDTFALLQEEVRNSDNSVGAWEMRQMPYEHPKIYDPVTRETSWMSGAAFAVRREIFEQIGGFDSNIFMYAEDVDLSWRIRALGYQLKYCPKVRIRHYSYQEESEVKPLQYVEAIKNNILLKYRYGSIWTAIGGRLKFWEVYFCFKEPFDGAKKELKKGYKKLRKLIPYFKKTRISDHSVDKFLGWDYELNRDGAFVRTENIEVNPLVSIIVRTCQRPAVLRETLISLRNQTYSNFEVVVVEDGESNSQSMIESEFADINVRYYATGIKKGRSVAGNLGLEKAKGAYINFLDDDDLFYADHIEILISVLCKTEKKAAYAFAFETPVEVYSEDPYHYKIVSYNKRYQQQFDKIKLCHHNYIPIQCIMFARELYEKLGGFDITLDYLEDWDLWVRYMQGTDFECVPKTTSLYKVPANTQKQKKRQKQLDEALKIVRRKHESYYIRVPVSDLVALSEEDIWDRVRRMVKH